MFCRCQQQRSSSLLLNFKLHFWQQKTKKATYPAKEAADQMIEGLKKELMAKQVALEVNYLNIYKL